MLTQILLLDISFTQNETDFLNYEGPKISYGRKPLGDAPFFQSQGILFQRKIKRLKIEVEHYNGLPYFFKQSEVSAFPYDIFGAAFYLLSRYEEYISYVSDRHDRFPVYKSLAHQYGFLKIPVVDCWAQVLLKLIQEHFPSIPSPNKRFKHINIIEIDRAYAYKGKDLTRNLAGLTRSFLSLNKAEIIQRIRVWMNLEVDPYDTYDFILALHKKYNLNTIFLFLLADYSGYDKNISWASNKYQTLIKSLADHAATGLHVSYFAAQDNVLFQKEKRRLEGILNHPVEYVRHHYSRIKIPNTYRILQQDHIAEDYSMGYPENVGFRAGTCTPFLFFDLAYNTATPIKVVPISIADVPLKYYMGLHYRKAQLEIAEILASVKQVKGTFVSIFHNDTFAQTLTWRGWQKIYTDMLSSIYEKPFD